MVIMMMMMMIKTYNSAITVNHSLKSKNFTLKCVNF